ncbi:MAG: hypothetical protein ACOC8E_07875 [Planctomycetota bacterium]
MNAGKALLTAAGTAAAFGVAGGIVGFLLGAYAPGYYRQVFGALDEGVQPTEFGLGLGVTRGLIWGPVIGVLLVAIIAWKETRAASRDDDEDA